MESESLFYCEERILKDGQYLIRALQRSDFDKGFPKVLEDLTTVEVEKELFLKTFDKLV